MEIKRDVPHGTWDYPFEVHHTILPNGLSLYPHIHEEFEITCITKGTGFFSINGQDYSVKEGNLLFIPSKALHLAIPDKPLPAAFFSIVFSSECFGLMENNRIYTKYIAPILNHQFLFPEYMDQKEQWQKQIWELCQEIASYASIQDKELLCQSTLLKLWYCLFQHRTIPEQSPNSTTNMLRLKDSIDYMHSHYSEHISIRDLSTLTHMSEGHFSRIFKEYTKMSPINYLIQIRIKESTKLLKMSDLPIGEIALNCGFRNFSYYSKHFRGIMNCSPHEYRKKYFTLSKENQS